MRSGEVTPDAVLSLPELPTGVQGYSYFAHLQSSLPKVSQIAVSFTLLSEVLMLKLFYCAIRDKGINGTVRKYLQYKCSVVTKKERQEICISSVCLSLPFCNTYWFPGNDL